MPVPIERENGTVVLFGADCQLTQITLLELIARGRSPVCIGDSRPAVAGKKYMGLPILPPDQIAGLYPDADVFICPSLEYASVHDMLWAKGMTRLHAAADILDEADLANPSLERTPEAIRSATQIQKQHQRLREGGVFLPMLNIVLTERCTLNCRLCSNLMPWIRDKRDFDADTIITDVKRLAQSIDVLVSAHTMGGEPLLHKGLAHVITELAGIPNLNSNAIVTNATHLPSAEVLDALAATPKGYVFISHYGTLSRRAEELKALLAARNIAFEEQPVGEWKDMGDVSRRGRTSEENRRVFANCTAKNCATLLDGHLYRCPRSAFGTRLGMIPPVPDEGIPIRGNNFDPVQTRERIKRLFSKDCLVACNYCDGTGIDMLAVSGGEQIQVGLRP